MADLDSTENNSFVDNVAVRCQNDDDDDEDENEKKEEGDEGGGTKALICYD